MATSVPVGPVGILGGTFDPIHFGHLRLAEEARESLALTRMMLIPAGQPPHRNMPHASAEHRLAMAQLAVAGNAAFTIDASEVRSSEPSYTVPTLARLRAHFGPTTALVLVLGADAFESLPSWHRWREMFDLAHIAVANRPGHPPHARRFPDVLSEPLAAACAGRFCDAAGDLADAPAGRILPFDMTPLAISASLIRARLAAGQSVRYLLPEAVVDYIQTHHLYL